MSIRNTLLFARIAPHIGAVRRRWQKLRKAALLKKAKKALSLRRPWRKLRAAWLRRNIPKLHGPSSLAANIRYFANPGPQFQAQDSLDARDLPSRARAVAFYLPQFHAFEENDQWWGEGFTEWRNVARGTPRFAGHYQPRIPRDLGFYDVTQGDTLQRQIELAQQNGIDAFCFYYYWFNGKRLMEKPLEQFLNLDTTQEFCIMWANENWTRTWDGFDGDILIEQSYHEADEPAFLEDTARYMRHPRYLQVSGRPLFILYRPGLLPEPTETLARWRKQWKAMLGVEPLMMMVQGFGDEDPREFKLDGAVEFPPHKVCAGLANINYRCKLLDPDFKGLVRSYEEVVYNATHNTAEPENFPLIKTVSPSWDNDARREGQGMVMYGSTPELYKQWLNSAIDYAQQHPVLDESLVFINAWNEWAEGAYLEPDVHFGHAYLNATKQVLKGLSEPNELGSILIVGHDAYRHGAQMILLNIVKVFTRQFGLNVTVLLKAGGPMLSEYRQYCDTQILSSIAPEALDALLSERRCTTAICNTTVTGDIAALLKKKQLRVLSLVHELPSLIKEYQLEASVHDITEYADHVVFPAELVKTGFESFNNKMKAQAHVIAQGLYAHLEPDEQARAEIRESLGLTSKDKLVIGVGYADLRKGFDLFMETARRITAQQPNTHFIWVGSLAGDMNRWVKSDLAHAVGRKQIHLVEHTSKMSHYYNASDCLFVSSREDPYPSVVLEAMGLGLPVLLFKGVTGFDALMSEQGYAVELGHAEAIDIALKRALYEDTADQKQARKTYVHNQCRYDDYCFDLLKLLHPSLKKVSVVVPNYNYEHYLKQRLSSVFSQNYPVFEVIVLDDASSDASVSVIHTVATAASRSIELMCNTQNSGNVFKQWQRAASAARGDYLWIAEADDSASSTFLSALMAPMSESTSLCFSDSKQIGSQGEKIADSYHYYVQSVDAELFSGDVTLSGREFVQRALCVKNTIMNVSAVVWSRAQLMQALETLGDSLQEHNLVGDWHLYVHLLSQQGATVSYVDQALNTHRRHQQGVTQALGLQRHFNEIDNMHQIIQQYQTIDDATALAMRHYLEELRQQFNLPADVDEAIETKRAA